MRLLAACVIGLVVLSISSVQADWINLTGAETAPNIAEIYINEDHVRVNLEVYVQDIKTFEELVPDDWFKDAADPRPPIAERMQRFSSTRLQFITEAGENLPAELKLVEPRMRVDRQSPFAGMINPMTRQRVPGAPSDKRVLYAELLYPFKVKPKELTIIPPLDEEGRAQVTIGFITYHKAVPIIDFRYLGAAAHVTLNWDDPWYTKFENPNLKRHHKSALMSFLYVEPYEVRHEILTRVKDLEAWMDLGLRDDEYIEVDELESLKKRIGEFLLTKNAVLVDGQPLKPILDRTNYVKVGLKGIQLLEQPERLEVSTAIVGVIITYLTAGLPQEVTVDWELFTDQIQQVPATATDPAGPLPTFITPDDNVHRWTNFLKNYTLPTVDEVSVADTVGDLNLPVGTLLCLGLLLPLGWQARARRRQAKSTRIQWGTGLAAVVVGLVLTPYFHVSVAKPVALVSTLSDQQTTQILRALLKNVYRAFDFREENDVYDKLALSVDGDLLAEVYLQNRASFSIQKAGGAQAKIKDVEVLRGKGKRLEDSDRAFVLTAQWTAMGTVGHWGHVHTRKNHYEAMVTIEAREGNWKITGLELLEEKRIDPYAQQVAQK